MKKIILSVLLLSCLLVSCKKQDTTPPDSTVQHSSDISYETFLGDLKNNQADLCYFIKDIDGNGVDDLIILENTALSFYTFETSVKFIGEYDFMTGTVGFFDSDNISYPGIFYSTTGGGVNHYGYVTVKDGKLLFEALWEENFFLAPPDSTDNIIELSSNKELISESKEVFDEDHRIDFIALN